MYECLDSPRVHMPKSARDKNKKPEKNDKIELAWIRHKHTRGPFQTYYYYYYYYYYYQQLCMQL